MGAGVTVKRPPLRYHGGKWKLAPWIISMMPVHRFYVEPFGGGASVLLRKPRSYGEVYNDRDGEIVNLFRVMRSAADAESLTRALLLTPYAREEFSAAYQGDGPADPIEIARRTVIKALMGYGGNATQVASSTLIGMRTTPSRWSAPTGLRVSRLRGTTPATDWARYPNTVASVTERFRGVVIENRDAVEVMLQHDDVDTLHYLDPPYVPSTRKSRHRYRHEMSEDSHRKLASVAQSLNGMVMISGYPSTLYDDELYSSWDRFTLTHHSQNALKTLEVLWINGAAMAKRKTMTLELGLV